MKQPPYFYQAGYSRERREIFRKTPRLMSLDFDGTLAEIAPTPAHAHMGEPVRMALWGLKELPETKLVILSGRSISDLKQKVRLPGIVYVGNHGMDISPPSAGWGIQALRKWTEKTRELKHRLEPLVPLWPGSFLEPKGPDLSLHYRRLKPRQVKQLIPEALKMADGLPFTARTGKCVLEFKPLDSPGKGDALVRLADRFFKIKTQGICFHIGDDAADEEAFAALRRMSRRGLGFKVGDGPTRAQFRLRNCGEVLQFLNEFMDEG